jgi:hypothetical protein
MTTWVTARGIALAIGVLTPAVWLLWAEHLAGGWRTVLASAGLWWLAALQATWPVWLPAAVALLALGLALPPRAPRRPVFREPAAPRLPPPAGPAEGGADGVTERAASEARPDPARPDAARRWVAELLAFARTPEGAAALAAEREAARGAGAAESAPAGAGGAGGSDPAPTPTPEVDEEEGEQEEELDEDGEDDDAEPEVREPAQESTPAPPRAVAPGSAPAPPRTVWEAFAAPDQEDDDAEDDEDDA